MCANHIICSCLVKKKLNQMVFYHIHGSNSEICCQINYRNVSHCQWETMRDIDQLDYFKF